MDQELKDFLKKLSHGVNKDRDKAVSVEEIHRHPKAPRTKKDYVDWLLKQVESLTVKSFVVGDFVTHTEVGNGVENYPMRGHPALVIDLHGIPDRHYKIEHSPIDCTKPDFSYLCMTNHGELAVFAGDSRFFRRMTEVDWKILEAAT